MIVFLCEILIYCVLNNQDRQLGDLWPERAVVAIIKDKKSLPNKRGCSVAENHSLKKKTKESLFWNSLLRMRALISSVVVPAIGGQQSPHPALGSVVTRETTQITSRSVEQKLNTFTFLGLREEEKELLYHVSPFCFYFS